ncbi:MAG: hypothetical protein KGI29_05430 [Pseudomonadota bacterium]|nr:hypothetical protein [Pseudomonadota bacterium]MDE3037505.1 hypothetical protein [Pseudomonadota bacterium]
MDKVLHRVFTHEKADFGCRFLVIFTVGLSILRGIRFPSKWASTQYLLTYDVGFVRRGFIGALLKLVFGNVIYQYDFIQSVILINYILCIAAFIGFSLFLLRKSNEFLIPLLVFFSSPAFVFFNDVLGYFDQIGFLISSMYIIGYRYLSRLSYSILYLVIISVLFLTHEGQVILWGGILSYMLFLKMGGWNFRLQEWFYLAYVLLITVLTLYVIDLSFLNVTADQMNYIRNEIHRLSNFQIREDYLNWMVGGSERTRPAMRAYWQSKDAWAFLAKSSAIHLPVFLYFMCAMRYYARSRIRTIGAYILPVALALLPLALHFFGFDTNRWNAYCVISIFMLTIVCMQVAAKTGDRSVVFRKGSVLLGICVIMLNMNSSNYFFDGYQQSFFPYENHIMFWDDVFSGREQFPYHPVH